MHHLNFYSLSLSPSPQCTWTLLHFPSSPALLHMSPPPSTSDVYFTSTSVWYFLPHFSRLWYTLFLPPSLFRFFSTFHLRLCVHFLPSLHLLCSLFFPLLLFPLTHLSSFSFPPLVSVFLIFCSSSPFPPSLSSSLAFPLIPPLPSFSFHFLLSLSYFLPLSLPLLSFPFSFLFKYLSFYLQDNLAGIKYIQLT